MLRTAILLVALTVVAPALAGDDKPYTLEDLNALVKSEAWGEILERAKDVAPRDRKAPWKAIVEKAAVGFLEEARQRNAAEAFSAAYALPVQFPTLKKSKRFMMLRVEVGIASIGECFAQSRWGGVAECMKILDSFLTADPKNAEAHYQAGKVVRLHTTPHGNAAPYFLKALSHEKDKAKRAAWCQDDDVELAMVSAFGMPRDWDAAKAAKRVVFQHCYEQLGEAAYEAFLSGGRYEALNLCEPLQRKRKLSAFQKAHCKDAREEK